MTFAACLTRLEAEGTIDAERAARFRSEYDRLNTAYGKSMGTLDASMAATRDAMDALDFAAQRDAIQKVKQIGIQRELLAGFTAHIENGGKAGHYLAAIMDHHEGAKGVASVSNIRASYANLAWSRMGDYVKRYKRNLLGVVSNRADEADLARALRGEKVDNANAQLIADSVADTFEYLRLQYNKLGGNIPKLANWGLPQSHDALLIGRAGIETWKSTIRKLIDPRQMIDNMTGKAFADEAALDEALDAVWKNITSEGMDGQIPGAFTGKGKMANRRADHRFLVFKDSDSWLAYNEKFGRGGVFDAITGHIDSMTQDMAAMRVLGPNPALTIRWLNDIAQMDALPTMANGVAVKLEKDAASGAALMDRMWRYYSGEMTMPQNRSVARFFQGAKNWNVATKLGRAFISAFFTDPMWAATNSKFNGLPQFKMLQTYVASFNPLDASHRDAARHAGIISHELTSRTERMWREGSRMRFNLYELTSRSADAVLRTTLLTPSTIAWKETNALSWMKEWAEQADVPFDKLGKGQRLAFERYGINAADWDLLRSTGIEDGNGVKILRPGDLARREDIDPDAGLAAALKYFSLIDAEGKTRVVGEGLRAQTAAMTLGGAVPGGFQKGNVGGELLHSTTQFKTFGVAAMINSWTRTMYGEGAIGPKEFLFRTVIGVTLGGVLAEQMIALSDGKDPLPWDETLLARGFARGGGAGLLGDILSQGVSNDRGNTVAGFASGPLAATFVDPAFNLLLGNAGELARGEETNAGREALRTVKNNLPGGNAWYAKLAMNRLFLEELDAIADPDSRAAQRRTMKRAEEQGTDFWWAPGENAPDRAPDLAPKIPALSEEQGGFEP